jgi:hypothetical protein
MFIFWIYHGIVFRQILSRKAPLKKIKNGWLICESKSSEKTTTTESTENPVAIG